MAAETGVPLPRAEVRLDPLTGAPSSDALVIATDEQGRYEFRNVPAGRHSLSAWTSGYVSLSYGQRRPFEGPRPFEIADAQALQNVDFSLPKGGVIVARVTDELGEPIAGVKITAQQPRFFDGERRLLPVTGGGSLSLFSLPATNDLGEQRLYGLPPGDYYVSANASNPVQGIAIADRGRNYVATYYPGTRSPGDAERVTVRAGQEVSVSFPVVTARLNRLSGTIRSAAGEVLRGASASLVYSNPGLGLGMRWLAIQPDGSFTAVDVLPDDDVILNVQSSTLNASAAQEVARMPITMTGQDVARLIVTTSKGAALRGRLTFDTGAPPANMRPDAVQLTISYPSFGSGLSGPRRWNADWTFEMSGLLGAGGLIRLGAAAAPAGWFLKAVMLDGRDVTDTPLDFTSDKEIKDVQVILTQKQSELSGGAVDADGAAVSEYAAVIFPEDRQRWTPRSRFIAAGLPDQQGRFKIGGLPPGDYLVAAVEYLESGTERDPELLARLADQAAKVTLREGEAKAVSLRLVPQ